MSSAANKSARRAAELAATNRSEASLRADRLRELAADTDDPEERERLLGAAAEADGLSLNGAGFSRPQG